MWRRLTLLLLFTSCVASAATSVGFVLVARKVFDLVVTKVTIPAPAELTVRLTSGVDRWHLLFCDKPLPNGCVSRMKKISDPPPGFLHASASQLAKARQAAKELYAQYGVTDVVWHDEDLYVDLTCCASSTRYGYGYLLGTHQDVAITYEHAEDQIFRISCITWRHCRAPPSHPLGVPHAQASATNATWPGHWHTWLVHPPRFKAKLDPDELGVWTESLAPFRRANEGIGFVGRFMAKNILPVVRFGPLQPDTEACSSLRGSRE